MKDLHIYKNHNIKSTTNLLHFENTPIFQGFSLENDNELTSINTTSMFISQIKSTSQNP